MTGGLRTTIYIDGFNLYYGSLKNTTYKWLDLESLFGKVLSQKNQITKIKYFTANVQATESNPNVHVRQQAYLQALIANCPLVEIHYGHYVRRRKTMENISPPPVKVTGWNNEEKGSDVNLALHVLNDAWLDAYDCAVIVSNDSDLAESLNMVKHQHTKTIGLITPGAPVRKTSWQLKQYADFIRTIRPQALINSQLPASIPGTKITKPSNW
jgi:uncharacterized LabA/DUF88 family protein